MADLSLKDALLLAGGGTDSSGGSGGKDGVGIASLEINDDGELVVTLDNGRVKISVESLVQMVLYMCLISTIKKFFHSRLRKRPTRFQILLI